MSGVRGWGGGGGEDGEDGTATLRGENVRSVRCHVFETHAVTKDRPFLGNGWVIGCVYTVDCR
jgi:hypothetical protein